MDIEAVDRESIITILTRVRRNRATITYGEFADDINKRTGGDYNPHYSFNYSLGRIQEYCRESGVPCLPCMVVKKQKGALPSEGFIKEYRTLNPNDKRSDLEITRAEQNACRDCQDWQKLLDYCGIGDWELPEARDIRKELAVKEYVEGASKMVEKLVKKVKRDQDVRSECLRIHSTKCAICGFDSEAVYGVPGIIHAHHLHPVWEGLRKTDPEKDMIPVCPNCHALIHSKGDKRCYEPDDVRKMIEECKASEDN